LTIRHINYRIASSGPGENNSLPVIVCSEKADDNIKYLSCEFSNFSISWGRLLFMAKKFIETDHSLG